VKKGKVAVVFEPQGKRVHVERGTLIREAAAEAGLPLDSPCGGQGTCGKCKVRVLADPDSIGASESMALSAEERDQGFRLACQSRVIAPTTIEVPETSLVGSAYQILTAAGQGLADDGDPPVRKQFVELPKPSLEDGQADLERLREAAGPFEASLSVLRCLPKRLRDADFTGTSVISSGHLIDFEPGDTSRESYVAAFDIGTTTLVGVLLDMTSGRECASASRMNPQTHYGDDVLTRINHACNETNGLGQLHGDIINAINEMIQELTAHCRIPRDRVYQAAFAGNTTMQHLLTAVDPGALGTLPFVPAVGGGLVADAADLGIHIHPRGHAYVFPSIGGFVGGDTVAGILVTGLAETADPVMFVDIGTNGEIVLHKNGELLAASCAAGPAFEGARIQHGMRAAAGAIEEIAFENGDIQFKVIGGVKPSGLCGSALIDAAAGLLRHGILGSEGLLLGPDSLPDGVPEGLRERVVDGTDGAQFVIATAEESQTGHAIALTHRDVREMQLGVAAIRAGVAILLKRAGLDVAGLGRLMVAGGFGNYLRRENAQRLGLLPAGLEASQFAFIGNATIAGARYASRSETARSRADELARRTTHIELSLDVDFQNEYVQAMFFPFE
jgi:uncharacterized 2Fe-2S/4Fe-4S cluster protein (DUF4445 family)